MADFINPVPCFEDLVYVFEEGSRTSGGITIDEDLCRHMAEVLTDAAEGVGVLVDFARSSGFVQPIDAALAPRTPTERRQLARLAARLDPEGRVLALPIPARRPAAINEGGSAA